MRKYLIYSWAAMLISVLGLVSVYATGDKSSELKLKMTEISTLQQNLTGKIAQAIEKKE